MIIRKITSEDNASMSKIIKDVFEEFGIPKEGTVYSDPATDHLYELFRTEKAVYWVAEDNGIVVGGCGIYPTAGLPDEYTELVKLYVSPTFRGGGVGKILINQAIKSADELGYLKVYLESFPELEKAVSIYEKIGFKRINNSLGNSGHHACTIWMELTL